MSTVEIVEERWRTTLGVTVRGVDGQEPDRREVIRARRILRAEVDQLEIVASRFRPDSQLSEVNRGAGHWVPVGSELVELVEVALAAAEATDGLVDPCLGHQVDAAGYRSWEAAAVGVLPTYAATAHPGAWREVSVAPCRVRIPSGVALDLGATAKAWLADEVAERIAEETGLDVVANMGGDLRAISHADSWVLTADHEVPGMSVRQVEVTDAGLATSGQGRRRWLTSLGPAHHIIDPRTGRSARTSWWAVSALAASATSANVAATAGMLLDDRGPAWFAAHGLDGVFTAWSGAGAADAQHVGRWPGMGTAA